MNAARSHSPLLEQLLLALPDARARHEPQSPLYQLLKLVARQEVRALFGEESAVEQQFPPFGGLAFPYFRMGAIDSLDLFGLDELIIFSFYWANRARYRRTLDIGANIGLHSILMDRCGFSVRAFEPDPKHFAILQRNLSRNRCQHVQPICAAVSSKAGTMEFVRLLGNSTGSHLAGSKPTAYGAMERFPVAVEAITSIWAETDLIKLDAEGHEREILSVTTRKHWEGTDAMIEVGNEENAAAIFDHLQALGVCMFAQKINWRQVVSLDEMPVSHRDGSLFISARQQMPWG